MVNLKESGRSKTAMLRRLWHVKNEHIKSLRRQKKNPDVIHQGSFLYYVFKNDILKYRLKII